MARKFFDHEQFNFEFECALGGVHYGAGDIGEMMATADRVVDGDADSWCGERIATAERVGTIAEKSAKSGNEVSARTAYLRAATYYAMALPGWTKLSPTLDRAFARSRDCSDDLRLRVPGDRVVNAPTHGWVDLERLQVGEINPLRSLGLSVVRSRLTGDRAGMQEDGELLSNFAVVVCHDMGGVAIDADEPSQLNDDASFLYDLAHRGTSDRFAKVQRSAGKCP
jgi:hypothetical protein